VDEIFRVLVNKDDFEKLLVLPKSPETLRPFERTKTSERDIRLVFFAWTVDRYASVDESSFDSVNLEVPSIDGVRLKGQEPEKIVESAVKSDLDHKGDNSNLPVMVNASDSTNSDVAA
jgi:hypothetical protein